MFTAMFILFKLFSIGGAANVSWWWILLPILLLDGITIRSTVHYK